MEMQNNGRTFCIHYMLWKPLSVWKWAHIFLSPLSFPCYPLRSPCQPQYTFHVYSAIPCQPLSHSLYTLRSPVSPCTHTLCATVSLCHPLYAPVIHCKQLYFPNVHCLLIFILYPILHKKRHLKPGFFSSSKYYVLLRGAANTVFRYTINYSICVAHLFLNYCTIGLKITSWWYYRERKLEM